MQIENHADANGNEQNRSHEQCAAQQQGHTFPLRLTWPCNPKTLYEHLNQVFQKLHTHQDRSLHRFLESRRLTLFYIEGVAFRS
jgi:hypothetical protein